ncbi:MAG: cell division protein FtsI (penicillin-binding protein 3) [Gammaproteobacteria bacterium]|jgi:cell division protein FtsI (penicillin-binding protein 3)|tara:strand:- start:1319 stop:2944 length:1626 start_codon:yes stop_codon:yes gene_type:complete
MTMKKISYINWRLVLVCSCLSLAVMSVTYRMISLQLEDSAFLQNEGKKRYIKYRTLNPVRGTIFDRNNFPLAVSIVNYDLYALRGLNIDRFLKIKDNIALEDIMISGPSFSRKTLLKKNLTKEEQLLVNKLNFNELEMEVRHSRHYPLGDQISPLIGFYGTDGAQEGIEKSYDPFLSGVQGRQKYYTNAKQEIISKPIEVSENISGNDLQLTIDSTIQFYAYKYLVESIISNKAKAGTVIILDNKKGEVLAIASYPSYNPNSPKRVIQKNRALVEAYELGSVLKPIVFSKAVDLKLLNPDEYIDIPRRLQLGSKVISDTKSYNKLTPKEIIAYSSQVGASKIALLLGYDALKANYYNFGFSGPISINFPSSAFGLINAKEKISDRELASLGYGYGFTVSPFQITAAYSAFANKGILKDFKLITSDEVTSKRVISEISADHTLDALQKVIKVGTGKNADIKGFSEGGKTGTVHRTISGSGYAEDLYRASFIGITPLSEESLTIFISIEDPGLNSYSGGAIAAPLFAKIAESSLNYLGYIEDE